MPNPMEKMAQVMGAANGGQPMAAQAPYPPQGMPMPMNPMQRVQMVMQAMRNPAQIIFSKFPDIPENIRNDPNQILQYLQQSRNISNQDIQGIMNQIPNQYRGP